MSTMIEAQTPDGTPAEVTLNRVNSTSFLGLKTPHMEHRILLLDAAGLLHLRDAADKQLREIASAHPEVWAEILTAM